jgi:hypothetical protein
MAFTLSAALTIQGVANSYRVTGFGNLTDLQTCVAAIPAPFTATWNGNTLTLSGGGTAKVLVIAGTLIEQRVGTYNVMVDNQAFVCWGDSTTSTATTLSAGASAGITSISVASATNIVVGGFLKIGSITTGGENGSFAYKVKAVSGTTVTLNTPLASAVTTGASVTVVGSSTLGSKNASGPYESNVQIQYTGTSMPAYSRGTDPLSSNNAELCFVGNYGVLNFVSGSLAISNTNGRQDLDWYKTSLVMLDNVQLSQSVTTTSWQHFFYSGSSGFSSTDRTTIIKNSTLGGVVLESGGATPNLNIQPFFCNSLIGLGFTSNGSTPLPGGTYTVAKPSYSKIGFFIGAPISGSGVINLQVFDPAYYYFGPAGISNYGDPSFEIFRTFSINWKKPDASAVGSVAVPAKLVAIGGSAPATGASQNIVTAPRVTTSTSESVSAILRQSQKARATAYSFDGASAQTGFTDDASYNLYLVSYGYATQFLNVSAKPASASAITTSGFSFNSVSTVNEIANAVTYASVVTAGFSFDKPTATLSITSSKTTDQIGQYLLKLAYDEATDAYWRNLNHNPASAKSSVCDIGAINVSVASGVVISSGTVTTGLKTTGAVSLASGASASAPIEDSAGVRVTVKAPTPTTEFNISARYGTTTFTNLGFFTATGEITFTVPKGQPLEVAIWAFSYSTYVTTIDTTDGGSIFTAPLAINTAVDTTLNVDSYLSKIALSLDESGATPKLVLTVNEPMVVSGIELGKAITHKVAGLQVALTAALTFGDVTPLDIEPTEILNNLPAFSLVVGAAVTASQRVYFDFFINTAPAIAIDPTYVLNPIRADGNQVQILRVKPDIDPAQMAAGVIAGGVATSAQVLARPTLAQIEVAGGKLDMAMKAAKSAKLNTMG